MKFYTRALFLQNTPLSARLVFLGSVFSRSYKSAFSLLLSIWLFNTPLLAEEVDCNQYTVAELKDICNRFSPYGVQYHRNTAPDGLNALVDSWGSNPGLHLIPGQDYDITKTVDLDSAQVVLPIPDSDSSLPPITLNATSTFTPTGQRFALLRLRGQGTAGGITSEASRLPESLNIPEGNSSLVEIIIDGDMQAELAGSMVTDRSSGRLTDVVHITGSAGSTGKALLRRNIISPGDNSTGVHSQLDGAQQLEMTNNLITLTRYNSTGVFNESAHGEFRNNDISFDSYCERGCKGFRMNNVSSFVLTENAFWAGSGDSEYKHSALYLDNRVARQGEFTGNSMSPNIKRLAAEYNDDVKGIVVAANFQNLPASSYPWNTPEQFFAFTDNGGALPVPLAVLMDIENYIDTGTNSGSISQLQHMIPFNNTGATIYTLSEISQRKPPEIKTYCMRPSGTSGTSFAGGITMGILVWVVMPVVSTANCIFSYKMGSKKRVHYRHLQTNAQ